MTFGLRAEDKLLALSRMLSSPETAYVLFPECGRVPAPDPFYMCVQISSIIFILFSHSGSKWIKVILIKAIP